MTIEEAVHALPLEYQQAGRSTLPSGIVTLEHLYAHYCAATGNAIGLHLPALRALATNLDTVVEFGVRAARSSVALLLGARRVISYDIVEHPNCRVVKQLAGDRWDYRLEDSRTATLPQAVDMLFIDSLHVYEQCQAELERHARQVSRYLAFHDTALYGCRGEIRGTLGIRFAIDELQIRDHSWQLRSHDPRSAGLLVLERS